MAKDGPIQTAGTGNGDITIKGAKAQVAAMVEQSNHEIRAKVIRQMGEKIVDDRVDLIVRATRHLDGIAEKQKKLYDKPDNIRYVRYGDTGDTVKKVSDYTCDTGLHILALGEKITKLTDAINKCLDADKVKDNDYCDLSKVLIELGCSSGCKH